MAAQQPAYGGLDIAGIRAIYGIPDRCHSSAYNQMDKQTRSLAKPNRSSDTHKIPKIKYAYRRLGRQRLPTKDCTCSISRNCIHKPQSELDCRSLAPNPRESAGGLKITSGRLVDTSIRKNLDQIVHTVSYFSNLSQSLHNGTPKFTVIHGHIRKWISDMKCFPMIPEILAQSNILNIVHHFFGWIIANTISYRRVPQDIRYDLEWLKRKWKKGDLDLSDCLRGINVDQYRLTRSLDKEWKFYRSWSQFGNNGLIVGETWPNQIAIIRDGGHGAMDGGISGIVGHGATSVILSDPEHRDDYADIDEGEKVEYVSTASRNTGPTRCTQLMIDLYDWRLLSEKIKQENEEGKETTEVDDRPVRLFRSWRLSKKNSWRPRSGFRYDGLYDVTGSQPIDTHRALYRFTLQRREGQGPIRVDQPDNQMCLLYYQVAGVQRAAKRKFSALSSG